MLDFNAAPPQEAEQTEPSCSENVTVLISTSGKFATKQFSPKPDGGIKNRSYGSETYFSVASIPVGSIRELGQALEQVTDAPYAFVVRGEPLPGINRQYTRRLVHADKKTGDPATFSAQPRHAFIVDIDHIACPAAIDPVSDPEGAIEYVIGLLPPDLQDATCWWQFSSSQSVTSTDTLSVHLWFWSALPLGNDELKRWGSLVNKVAGYKLVDTSLYNPVQPHYVATPIFNGIINPLPRRFGLRQGLDDEISLIIPEPSRKNPEEPSAAGYEPGLGVDAYLAQIGGPQGFRAPIVSAISSWVAVCGIRADPAQIKAAVRNAILRVGDLVGSEHWFDNDDHLDAIIEWVRTQHGDQPPKGARRPETPDEGVRLEDFWSYMPQHNYIFAPTRSMWPSSSVNVRLGNISVGGDDEIPASVWLDTRKPVEQMTWAPGLLMIVRDRLLHEGGWIDRKRVSCFNLYLPPVIVGGDPNQAGPWIDHIKYIYPDDADHMLNWLAHRAQRPEEKINHSLVLGGKPGIGKDTLLEPVKQAIGPWNFQEVSPSQITGRFNGYLKSVILRISEARDTGGNFDRYQFYEHTKVYMAAPPDVLRIDEKHTKEYPILNVCGVIITTNHKTDGLYLPADDRRHHVAWSEKTKEDPLFQNNYWNEMWAYYDSGGFAHVAAYLRQRDISSFDPKAPPPKTDAFWAIVDSNNSPEEPELMDVLEQLGRPNAVTLAEIQKVAIDQATYALEAQAIRARGDFREWICDRKNRRAIPHKLEACGYAPARNPGATDGLWKIASRRQAVYAKAELSEQERRAAATELTKGA